VQELKCKMGFLHINNGESYEGVSRGSNHSLNNTNIINRGFVSIYR